MKYIPESMQRRWSPQENFLLRDRTPEYIDYNKRLFQKELQLVSAMRRAGVPFLTGTDLSVPYVFAGFGVHDELALFVNIRNTQHINAVVLKGRYFSKQELQQMLADAEKIARRHDYFDSLLPTT